MGTSRGAWSGEDGHTEIILLQCAAWKHAWSFLGSGTAGVGSFSWAAGRLLGGVLGELKAPPGKGLAQAKGRSLRESGQLGTAALLRTGLQGVEERWELRLKQYLELPDRGSG